MDVPNNSGSIGSFSLKQRSLTPVKVFWQFYWVSFLPPQQSHCCEKWWLLGERTALVVVSFFPVGVPVPSGLSMRTTIVRLTTIHNLEEQEHSKHAKKWRKMESISCPSQPWQFHLDHYWKSLLKQQRRSIYLELWGVYKWVDGYKDGC